MLDSALGSSLGGITVVIALLSAVLYVIPVLVLGMMFYYFTGDKPGRSIMHNFYNVAFRLYVQIWTFVSALVAFFGLQQFFLYPLSEALPNEMDYRSDILVKGLLYVAVATGLFYLHHMLANKVKTEKQKNGSVMTKMFLGLGIFVFSLIFLFSTLGFVDNLVGFLYNTDFMPFGASNLSTWFASGILWGIYIYNSLVTFKKEAK